MNIPRNCCSLVKRNAPILSPMTRIHFGNSTLHSMPKDTSSGLVSKGFTQPIYDIAVLAGCHTVYFCTYN